MELEIILRLVETVGTMFVIFLLVTRLVGKKSDADKEMYKAFGLERKAETEAWMGLVTRQRQAIEGAIGAVDGLTKKISADNLGNIAYQNTTANAITQLLIITKDVQDKTTRTDDAVVKLADVPKKIDETHIMVGDIQTKQNKISSDEDAIQTKVDAMQKEVQRMVTAMDGLPDQMRAVLEPLVTRFEMALNLMQAQMAQAKIDDLPLVENGGVEKDLLEDKPHPLTPSPLHGEGELATPLNGGDGSHSVKTEGENMPTNGQN